MKTRDYTKLFKNEKISKITIETSDIKGEIVITRFRPVEEKEIAEGMIRYTTEVGNEVDITFSGSVMSSRGFWHQGNTYPKTALTRWLRRKREINTLINQRICLLGGKNNIKIKKIEVL
jgi:hypothetical protein